MKLPAYLLPLVLVFATGCQFFNEREGGVTPYPLDVCLVTGNELGSMGDAIVKIYGDKEIKFCCSPCVKEFEEEKDFFLKQLEEDRKALEQ